MVAVVHPEQRVDVVTVRVGQRVPNPTPGPTEGEDGVLDGWIASFTADQFEQVLASLARVPSRW